MALEFQKCTTLGELTECKHLIISNLEGARNDLILKVMDDTRQARNIILSSNRNYITRTQRLNAFVPFKDTLLRIFGSEFNICDIRTNRVKRLYETFLPRFED